MIIPGIIISFLTFPGVIIHELAHQIICYLCGLKVYEVKYFQLKNPCGYVLHEGTDDPRKVFFTAMGPFLINTLLGALLILPVSIEVIAFKNYQNIFSLVMVWLGFSILMHAFPSTGDAKVMVENILKNKDIGMLTKIVITPFIALVYVGAIGSVFWLDAIYAAAVALILPNLLIYLF